VLPLAVVVGDDAGAGAGEGRGFVLTTVPPVDRGVVATRVGALVVGDVVLGLPDVGTS
jgi:hypothetical protein